MTYQLTAKGDIGRTHLALGVNIIDAPHVMIGSSQTMGTLQLQYLVNLTSIDQTVATQNPLVLGYWHDNLTIETHDLDQRATFYLHQTSLAD